MNIGEHNMAGRSGPLVSVGVPTYNRPGGLRRTLECITSQSYRNLEIIVSDNASPGSETMDVVSEYMSRDGRIKYVRQKENIGVIPNFQFVLQKSTGEYFMWAADDDEWDPSFIEFCIDNIGGSGSIMTAFYVKNRIRNEIERVSLPALSGLPHCRTDIRDFVRNAKPSMFYGLHRRMLLSFFLEQKAFDWMDCYFCLRLIWQAGYKCRNEVCLYTAGVDAERYVVKPFSGNRLKPLRYVAYSFRYVIRSRDPATLARHFSILLAPYLRFSSKKIGIE